VNAPTEASSEEAARATEECRRRAAGTGRKPSAAPTVDPFRGRRAPPVDHQRTAPPGPAPRDRRRFRRAV